MSSVKNHILMEFPFPATVCTFIAPLFLIFLSLKLLNLWNHRLLPPGPPKLPFFGNMNKLSGPTPHRALYELANKYGPVMHLKLGFVSTIVVSSAEVAEEVMKEKDIVFANRPQLVAPKLLGYNYSDVAFAPYGAYWRQLRKICILELMNAKKVQSFRFIREEENAILIRSIARRTGHGEALNLVEKLFNLNHDVTTRIVFGEKAEDQRRFRDAMKEGTVLAGGFQIGDFFPSLSFISTLTGMQARLKKTFLELDSITDQIIQAHVKRNGAEKMEQDDLLGVLLSLKDSGRLQVPLTLDNIKSVILDIFVGGTENASNSIEWAMSELIKNPKLMEKAQAEVRKVVSVSGKATVEETDLQEMRYIKSVIKETLRFHPPVPLLLPRESMERCKVKGYDIPAKTRTIINFWAIGRNPACWDNPDTFDPERFMDSDARDLKGQDFGYIPFGAGRRVCPGISYAMVNMELSLAALLYHFDWKLPDGMEPEGLDMDEVCGMTLFRKTSLHLVPTIRYPPP